MQPVKQPQATGVAYAPAARSMRRRIGSRARLWARATFSRDSLMSSVKSFAWVAPLTVLIWIYAEREHVDKMSNVPINISLRGNDPTRFVRLESPLDGSVHADLTGPQGKLDEVKELLGSRGVTLEIDHNLSGGEHEIGVAAELNRLPEIVSRGVTISACVPAELRVIVDPLKEVDVEVKARPEDLQKLKGPPVFTPAKVKIIGPRSVIDAAMAAEGRGRPLVAYAKLTSDELAGTGKQELSSVAVVPSVEIRNPNVSLLPTSVSAVIDVSNLEDTIELHGVTVLAAQPGNTNADKYKPVFDTTLASVAVTGPKEEIDQLRNQTFRPTAFFKVVYPRDINTPPDPAPLTYELPPHCHVSEQDRQRQITYTLEKRKLSDQ